MKRYRLDPKKPRRLTTVEESRLTATPIDYSDIPSLDKTTLAKATNTWPPAKQQLTIRLDVDVLRWLKGSGRGYQTRINHILRAVMEGPPPRRARPATIPRKSPRTRSGPKASA